MEQELTEFFAIDFQVLVQNFFTIIACFVASCALLAKFFEYIGKPLKWFKKQNQDHELTIQNSKAIKELAERHERDNKLSNKHDEEIKTELRKLTKMFIDKEIDDMRWEIINFSAQVAENRPCNKDGFQHCFKTYEKYEKIIKDNGLTNGEVEISMKVVNEAYEEKLKNGF